MTWYAALGLVTTVPNPDGSGFTEPTIGVGGYGRVAITNNVTNFPAGSIESGQVIKTNGTLISWGDPTTDWGTAAHVGFYDVATGGTVRWFFEMEGSLLIRAATTVVELPAGDLRMPFFPTNG